MLIRRFDGPQAYALILQQMRDFVDQRRRSGDDQSDQADECWLLEHQPVFTQGINGQPEHLLDAGNIPLVQSDRGGQITYHGPGQLICYLLLDLRRQGIGVKGLVTALEQAVIDLLAGYGVAGERRQGAPGIYVANAKIAALGLRIRHGCSYHGLSLNLDMDLEPFSRINPCGYQGLAVTQLAELVEGSTPTMDQVGEQLMQHLTRLLSA
ncbi:MAG: lipoyl(octanoyl) transferase LipB [Immundisolibacteraceae bacterium]|nr:lipoyl(octanoyl) transferase LipB [Immundisolibacteraceae bacterium]